MAIEVEEKFKSRRIQTGANPSVELLYDVHGTTDDVAAHAALVDASPEYYDPWGGMVMVLMRRDVVVRRVGPELWTGSVRYGQTGEAGESIFSFDTAGGTQHITQSLQNVGEYAPPGKSAPKHKGAIGVTQSAVEGVDIIVPVYQFSETHYLAASMITLSYKVLLSLLTGRVNDAAFKGFEGGEILFLGAMGWKRGLGDWEINYRFAASPNATNLTIGDIVGINKQGWQYLWVRYMDAVDEDASSPVKIPQAVYVEQVYEYANLSQLGI